MALKWQNNYGRGDQDMKIQKKHIIPSLFILLVVVIGLWTGMNISDNKIPEPDPGYWNTTAATITSVQTPLCHGYLYPVETEGYVYLGEGCLNITAGVSSGQLISWYKNGRNSEKDRPDESRIVQDARNFYVNPDEFAGFEGPWYVGTTDKVAFIVNRDTNAQMTTPGSFEDSGKFDTGVLAIINSTNQIDYARVWVILEEPSGSERDPGTNLTPEEKAVFREQQRAYHLNYTKPVVDYVRAKGFVVDYISQTSPSIEVLAPPPFMEELSQQPKIQKIVAAKASHPLIKEMLQRQPDETLRLMVSLTKPPGVTRWPGSLTEEQMDEYYSKNRVLFENHTRPLLDLLEKENISIQYNDPYLTGGFWVEIPVHLIEEFNERSDVVYMEREIPASLI
jgi:hypothetical protein